MSQQPKLVCRAFVALAIFALASCNRATNAGSSTASVIDKSFQTRKGFSAGGIYEIQGKWLYHHFCRPNVARSLQNCKDEWDAVPAQFFESALTAESNANLTAMHEDLTREKASAAGNNGTFSVLTAEQIDFAKKRAGATSISLQRKIKAMESVSAAEQRILSAMRSPSGYIDMADVSSGNEPQLSTSKELPPFHLESLVMTKVRAIVYDYVLQTRVRENGRVYFILPRAYLPGEETAACDEWNLGVPAFPKDAVAVLPNGSGSFYGSGKPPAMPDNSAAVAQIAKEALSVVSNGPGLTARMPSPWMTIATSKYETPAWQEVTYQKSPPSLRGIARGALWHVSPMLAMEIKAGGSYPVYGDKHPVQKYLDVIALNPKTQQTVRIGGSQPQPSTVVCWLPKPGAADGPFAPAPFVVTSAAVMAETCPLQTNLNVKVDYRYNIVEDCQKN